MRNRSIIYATDFGDVSVEIPVAQILDVQIKDLDRKFSTMINQKVSANGYSNFSAAKFPLRRQP